MSINIALKIASFVKDSLQDSAIESIANVSLNAAIQACEDLKKYKNEREGLNNIVVYLGSAIAACKEIIDNRGIFDNKRVMWRKNEQYNLLCVLIAIVHYQLGNQELVQTWLIDRMSPEGPWDDLSTSYCPSLEELGLTPTGNIDVELYRTLLKYKKYFKEFQKRIMTPSDRLYKIIESEEEYDQQEFERMCRTIG